MAAKTLDLTAAGVLVAMLGLDSHGDETHLTDKRLGWRFGVDLASFEWAFRTVLPRKELTNCTLRECILNHTFADLLYDHFDLLSERTPLVQSTMEEHCFCQNCVIIFGRTRGSWRAKNTSRADSRIGCTAILQSALEFSRGEKNVFLRLHGLPSPWFGLELAPNRKI